MDVPEFLTPIKEALEALFGARFKRLVLFGSLARGEAMEDSDIDLMVLLEGPIELGRDTRLAIEAAYPVLLSLGVFRPLHAVAADEVDYDNGRISLYRAAKIDGIAA
jgi:predicted nucleotidyltransferase